MKPTTCDAADLLLRSSLALSKASRAGIRIDEQYLDTAIADTKKKIADIEEELKSGVEWRRWQRRFGDKSKLTSTPQLATVLYDILHHKWVKETDKKKKATDSEALEAIGTPFTKKIMEMRSTEKLLATFLMGLKKEIVDGYFHPSFNVHTTTSYRSSSGRGASEESSSSHDLNFQNLPIRSQIQGPVVRPCYRAREGWQIAEIDFGAHEWKCASAIWGDPGMLAYCHDESRCIHYDWTAKCYACSRDQVSKPMRTEGKNKFVFPILYGSYYKSCGRNLWDTAVKMDLKLTDGTSLVAHLASLGIHCREDLQEHIKGVEIDFYKTFPTFAERKDRVWEEFRRVGHHDTVTGFRLKWDKKGAMSRNFLLNGLVQGPSFHVNSWCYTEMVKWLEKEKMRSLFLGQVHDCQLFDCPPDELDDVLETAHWYMTVGVRKHWDWITVPLLVEVDVTPISGNWHEKKPWHRNADTRTWHVKEKK